jgi:hypothetical protein
MAPARRQPRAGRLQLVTPELASAGRRRGWLQCITRVPNATRTVSTVYTPTELLTAWPGFWAGASIAAETVAAVSTTGRSTAELRKRISLSLQQLRHRNAEGAGQALEDLQGWILLPAGLDQRYIAASDLGPLGEHVLRG